MHTRSTSPRSRSRAFIAMAAAALAVTAACSAPQAGSGSATLTIPIQSPLNSFDPTQLNEGQAAFIWNAVYDTLVYVDNDGSLKPNAAQSWQYSGDARTLTFTLRPGMKFTSGAPVNAAAVKATMERTSSTPGSQQAKLSAIESIDTPDDLTVVLHLKQPDGSLLTSLSQAAGVIGDPATLNNPSSATDPVGSGPYVLDKEATVNASTYVLKRRADYWNVKAYPFETVKIRVIADPTASFNAFQSGEVNAAILTDPQAQQAQAAGATIKTVDATAVGALVIADRAGTLSKPLGDVRVRKAINMAFDRDKIVKQLLMGGGQPTRQVFNPKGLAYDPQLEQTYSYDPAAAKQLLAQAGYPNGFEVTMPSLVFSKSFEPTITQSLADIGVKVVWAPVPPGQTNSTILSKQYPMFFFLQGLNSAPREVSDFIAPTATINPFGSSDPQLTSLLNQANAEPDQRQAAGVYQQINKFLVDNAWNAPVFYVGNKWAAKEGIEYLGTGASTFSTVRLFGLSS